MTLVIKRDGNLTSFDRSKIETAIMKAMQNGSGIVSKPTAKLISLEAENLFNREDKPSVNISEIEKFVVDRLVHHGHQHTALSYEGYRSIRAYMRCTNTTDKSILSLIELDNAEVMNENSNKNPMMVSTQRDLIAGEISKDITRRKKLPAHIVQAHDEGVLHFHDADYFMQNMFNCCLVDIKDMLGNGTVINKRMVESPKTFQVACTVMTQIIAQVASSQYGGQSLNIKHLGMYLKRSEDRYYELLKDVITDIDELNHTVDTLVAKELASGVQTIQYQINTLMTTNGQSPFSTLFLEIDESDEYVDYSARVIEEVLKQRLQGIKNEKGVYTTPAFPKLVYVLDHHNCLEGGRFDYITELAVKCSAKRMYPDYISAKEMRKIYEGNVFSPMGKQNCPCKTR